MKIFGNKKSVPKSTAMVVTNGYFELERDGHVATLQYTVAGQVLALIHTEIPEALRGSGIATTLVKSALDWAREHHMKIDVVCPFVAGYLEKHPEYSDLILR
jgi:predicted GNAT family acetyltransferase